MSQELWLPIPMFDHYEVSNRGQVRSLSWTGIDRLDRPHPHRGQILRGYRRPIVPNYITVNLCRGAENPSTHLVHHLVLVSFVGNRPSGMECLHKDNDGSNNQLHNLKWGTHEENLLTRRSAYEDKECCPQNHRLQPPNLIPSLLPKQRACLACSRTRANRKQAQVRGQLFDFQSASDAHYAKIMTESDIA